MAVILWILAVLLGILVFLLLLGLVLLWVRAGVEAVGATGAVSVEARYGFIRIPVWPRPRHLKPPAPEKKREEAPKPKKARKRPKYPYSLNREELDVGISVGNPFIEVTHAYPDLTVHLTLFHAEILHGVPKKLEHLDIRWITPKEISQYAFCPADAVILQAIQKMHQ